MARKATISKIEAYRLAKKAGARFSKDYFQQQLSVSTDLVAIAKLAGYRKPKTASGSLARYFFDHLNRLRIKRGWK